MQTNNKFFEFGKPLKYIGWLAGVIASIIGFILFWSEYFNYSNQWINYILYAKTILDPFMYYFGIANLLIVFLLIQKIKSKFEKKEEIKKFKDDLKNETEDTINEQLKESISIELPLGFSETSDKIKDELIKKINDYIKPKKDVKESNEDEIEEGKFSEWAKVISKDAFMSYSKQIFFYGIYIFSSLTATTVIVATKAPKVEQKIIVEPVKKQEIILPKVIEINNIYFDVKQFKLSESNKEYLKSAVSSLKDSANIYIDIYGYTDNKGNKIANQKLSAKRAETVYEYLIQLGFDKARLTFKGEADANPIADNSTLEGRAKNRRVSFKIQTKN